MVDKKKLVLMFNIFFFHLFCLASFGENNVHNRDIETYLNSIKTLKARLIQISGNGAVETGSLFINKPGKMRFEYDPPSNHLVMASGLLLVVIDRKSTSEPQRYFTSQTPIGYLLNENISLNQNRSLKTVILKDSFVHITFYDPQRPTAGELELVFSKNPIQLHEWTITNYSGEETRVLLEQLIINEPVNEKLFNIGREISNVQRKILKNK
tara:strand:+ start:882 stop:1514 length:633 start_codon:yes stop_codon:yes gene_type:complete